MIVPDASVIVEVLLRTPVGQRAATRIFAERETLHAPELLDVEVVHVLRRHVARKAVSPERGGQAIELFARLPIERYPHQPLLARAWELRNNFTAYDAMYVALAEALSAVLFTGDKRIATALRGAATVELM